MQGITIMDPNRGSIPLTAALIEGILAPIFPGNRYYVNETTGQVGASGTASNPFSTLDAAKSVCTAGNQDTVFLEGSSHRTSTLTWDKNWTNLVALEAPSNNGRSRIASSGATPFSPLVNVTAQGCSFIAVGTFHGGFTTPTGSQVCWNDAGGRNYYKNVQFLGGGDAVAAALAGMRSLTIGGDGENLLEDCTLGLDTIVRASNPNATLEIIGGSARNVMRRPIFQSECSDAADVHVLIEANGMDRYLILDHPIFHNFGATSLNANVSNAGGSPGGNVIIYDPISIGATAHATAGAVYITGNIPNATTSGIAVLAT